MWFKGLTGQRVYQGWSPNKLVLDLNRNGKNLFWSIKVSGETKQSKI